MSTEKILEARLSKEVKKRGGYSIKLLPWVEVGLPDRLVVLPGNVTIFVELKSKKGELKGKQRIWCNRLLGTGHEHWVIFDEKSYNCLLERMDELTN